MSEDIAEKTGCSRFPELRELLRAAKGKRLKDIGMSMFETKIEG